jgi:hypothetical protein
VDGLGRSTADGASSRSPLTARDPALLHEEEGGGHQHATSPPYDFRLGLTVGPTVLEKVATTSSRDRAPGVKFRPWWFGPEFTRLGR